MHKLDRAADKEWHRSRDRRHHIRRRAGTKGTGKPLKNRGEPTCPGAFFRWDESHHIGMLDRIVHAADGLPYDLENGGTAKIRAKGQENEQKRRRKMSQDGGI